MMIKGDYIRRVHFFLAASGIAVIDLTASGMAIKQISASGMAIKQISAI